jgi:hypothetical protein
MMWRACLVGALALAAAACLTCTDGAEIAPHANRTDGQTSALAESGATRHQPAPSSGTSHRAHAQPDEARPDTFDIGSQAYSASRHVHAGGAPVAPSPSTPEYSAETRAFLESASSTLDSVLRHDAARILHFKTLVTRAKAHLFIREYTVAASLFRAAAKYYLTALKAPYAKIANNRALGDTIEEQIEARQAGRGGAAAGGSTSTDTEAESAREQFRRREIDNRPHVHTAFREYAEGLKRAQKKKKKKKSAASPAIASE